FTARAGTAGRRHHGVGQLQATQPGPEICVQPHHSVISWTMPVSGAVPDCFGAAARSCALPSRSAQRVEGDRSHVVEAHLLTSEDRTVHTGTDHAGDAVLPHD